MIFLSDFTLRPPFLTRLYQLPFDKLPSLAFHFLENLFVNVQVQFSVSVYQVLINSSVFYRPCSPYSLGCLQTPFMLEDAIPHQEALVLVDALQKS